MEFNPGRVPIFVMLIPVKILDAEIGRRSLAGHAFTCAEAGSGLSVSVSRAVPTLSDSSAPLSSRRLGFGWASFLMPLPAGFRPYFGYGDPFSFGHLHHALCGE